MKSGNLFAALFLLSIAANAQTGGTYDLSHNVIAGGGGSNSTGGQFTVDGTAGQNLAGISSTGGTFSLRGGFWAFQAAAPTAATVTLSGKITVKPRRGMTRVRIVLQNLSTGVIRKETLNFFGYYRFEELEPGFYLISAECPNYQFTPANMTINLTDNASGIDFEGVGLF